MPAQTAETIPLHPRRRLLGSAFGGSTSIRRGEGSDIASSRPYRPGDHFRTIDWKASARLSAARGSDEFVVRERFAEQMPRVVLVVDRRPEMALYPPDLPWLHKPAAVAAAVDLLVASALAHRALVGYVDHATHPGEPRPAGTAFWKPPRAQADAWDGGLAERARGWLDGAYDAPQDTVARALELLAVVRGAVPLGSFVFVLSDFTAPFPPDPWVRALDHGWDVVPLVVQDPVWEQSFPAIDGVLAPLADAAGGRLRFVRLGAREVEERRAANERRLRSLRTGFAHLGLDMVLLGDVSPGAVHARLLAWAETRLELRGPRA